MRGRFLCSAMPIAIFIKRLKKAFEKKKLAKEGKKEPI